MEETLIHYQGVALERNGREILSDVSFTLRPGELLYIMGEVGSGKSTLLKSIYGELKLKEARASAVLGLDVSILSTQRKLKLRRRLGIVFQDFQLLSDRTVGENLRFVLRATGWPKAKCRERIDEVLTRVGLLDKRDLMPYELSGGEQQTLCIARAMLNSPQLILADEPTANLAEASAERGMQLIEDLRKAGAGIVLSTHNPRLPLLHPGRIAICEGGKLREQTETKA